ncbi:hypothetical protein DAPPUDRAFT_334844 [Daphnia pulex]|uniref:Uncharacterized protein n=1 Tax=Daphnia pulex TaxID=6669 RepID=E9HWI8_DAPPU|nr:hypothetical protein DAPPUDRAFT_334844 [Daphnia pulex]|eukprot:EFX63894.1 hypothetical protein DAPPUDRAFT_334844 [Daphnia pulex]
MAPTKKKVKEEEYAVPSVSKKRTATAGPAPKVKRSVESLAPSTSNNKDAVSSKNAASKTFKAATTLRVGKTMEPEVVVRKFVEFLETVRSKEERDDNYNKLKLQEVTATLDTMSRPTVMKAVPEFVHSDDAPNLLNMLLDGLGESTKHGNKMVFAVMKSAITELRDNEHVSKAHASRIVKVLNIQSECQLNSRQIEVTTELTRLLMHRKWK